MGYGPAPGPTIKKVLCHTCPLGGASNKYRSHVVRTPPEEVVKRLKHALKKNELIKNKFSCGPIHFEVFTFFSHWTNNIYIYIYIYIYV